MNSVADMVNKVTLVLDREDVLWLYADLVNRGNNVGTAQKTLKRLARGEKLREALLKLQDDADHMRSLAADIGEVVGDIPIDFDSPGLV